MKCKKLLLILGIMVIVAGSVIGCGKNKKIKEIENSTSEKEIENVSMELSDISVIAANKTFKYTENHLKCPLYEWGNIAVFPVPAPEGYSSLEIDMHGVRAFGVDKDEWLSYLEKIRAEYNIIEDVFEYEGTVRYSIDIWDAKNNYHGFLYWDDDMGDNVKNCVYAYFYVGPQVSVDGLDNAKVLEIAKERIDTDREINILNISSPSNVKDGFGVYYIDVNIDYSDPNESWKASNYLVVMKDEEVVLFYEEAVVLEFAGSIEFIKNEDTWKLYVIKNTISTNYPYYQFVREFTLKDGKFELTDSMYAFDMLVLDEEKQTVGTMVTLKKNGELIDIYEVKFNDKYENDSTIPGYEFFVLGEKIGELDGSTIPEKEPEDFRKEIVLKKIMEMDGADIDASEFQMVAKRNKLFFIDICDGYKLKIYDMVTGEMIDSGYPVGENENGKIGVLFEDRDSIQYYNGMTVYNLHLSDYVYTQYNNVLGKNVLSLENLYCHYKNESDGLIYHQDVNVNIEENCLYNVDGDVKDMEFVYDYLFYISGNKVIKRDHKGNDTVVYEGDNEITDICKADRYCYILSDGKIYKYDMFENELTNGYSSAYVEYVGANLRVCRYDENEENTDYEALYYFWERDKWGKLTLVVPENGTDYYKLSSDISDVDDYLKMKYYINEEYIIMYNPAEDGGLYVGCRDE